jgi:conjugative transfer signal peptidase TraF
LRCQPLDVRQIKPIILILTCILSAALAAKHSGLGINYTSSLPIGIYQKSSISVIHHDDIVAVCLPAAIAHEGLVRDYLAHGHCPGGSVPVLKQVIAIPHDTVKLTNQQITVGNQAYFAPQQAHDHNGIRVKHFIQNGTYQNIKTYWLYGYNAPFNSWDSRYYGGVKRSQIIGVYKPVLIWPSRITSRISKRSPYVA